MKTLLIAAGILIVCAASAVAEVEAVNKVLSYDSPVEDGNFTVPAGKVLLLECVCFSSTWDANGQEMAVETESTTLKN